MARGELPGLQTDLDSTFTYSASTKYGHAQAGKDLCLNINTSGSNIGKASLAGNNEQIDGVFIALYKNKKASTLMGDILIMRQNAVSGCTPGSTVIGAANGKIKDTPTANASDGRGTVLEVLENVANGRVLVRYPL